MKLIRIIGCVAALALLQSCASMSKDECLNADWRTIGYEDGAQGLPAGRIGAHRKDCAKYGIKPNLEVYLAGRREGLKQYCTPENGYKVGTAGGNYAGVCPPVLESGFLAAYKVGHQLFSLRNALNQVQSDLNLRHTELDKIKKRIEKKSLALIADKTTKKERIELLSDIKDLTDRKARVEHQIKGLQHELNRRAAELAAFEQSHPGV